MANNWCTIESDPGERLELPSLVRTSSSDGWCMVSGVFTELMRGIGVKGVQVTRASHYCTADQQPQFVFGKRTSCSLVRVAL